jgi:hypothetical protein
MAFSTALTMADLNDKVMRDARKILEALDNGGLLRFEDTHQGPRAIAAQPSSRKAYGAALRGPSFA